MANMKLEDTILKAIDIITSKKIASAGYDKTIQATIVSCVDQTIGKYKIKYQDSILYAYGSNTDGRYTQGESVFVLVPNGDMQKDKTILGATKKLGTNYVTIMQGDQIYAPVGMNLVLEDTRFGLCSYLNQDVKILYSKDYDDNLNLIHLDINGLQEYIKSSSYMTIGGRIQTNLDAEQQYQGNYGILVGLDFKDHTTGQIITKYYTIDIDKMTGNPYRFINEVRQYSTFEIDSQNFVDINMISIFSREFPNEKSNKENDIFISDIQICGAVALSQDDLNSYSLVLITPKGYIFNSDSLNSDTRTIQAQIRVKGRAINLETQKVPFYWFVENVAINTRDSRYNKYGGQGWECLNKYNILQGEGSSTTGTEVRQYLPGSYSFSVTKEKSLIERTKYKCVAIYEGTILSKEITIINLDCQYRFYIVSDSGTQFHYDTGHPTLTCICEQKINGQYQNIPIDNMSFVWAKTNSIGNFESLPITGAINENDIKIKSLYNNIKALIDAEWILPEQNFSASHLLPLGSTIDDKYSNEQDRIKVKNIIAQIKNDGFTTEVDINRFLSKIGIEDAMWLSYSVVLEGDTDHPHSLKRAVSSTSSTQKIYKNKIIDLNIKTITRFATYKCSIFTATGNNYLGTASITILNLLEGEGLFSLVINNGSQVFKYNTHGVSPASKQNRIPLEIPSLSFTIFDDKGEKIDDDIVRYSDITWIVPVKNTMLKIDQAYEGQLNGLMTQKSYKNLMTFAYQIDERFDVGKMNNTIQLKVNYQGLTLVAHTNLTFTKEGLSGTNGTDFTCKIVPNAIDGIIPQIPTLYYYSNGTTQLNWRIDTNSSRWFNVELWHNGNQPIFSGNETGTSSEGKTVTIIKWEILRNKYSGEIQDNSNLEVTNPLTGNFSFNVGSYRNSWNESTYTLSWIPANIIKVTLSYDGFTYYATLPLVIVRYFDNNYRVKLKSGTGFQEVLYTSAGIQPTFNNRVPFEILLQQSLGSGNYAEIGSKTTSAYNLYFNWFCLGTIRQRTSNGWSFVYNETEKWIMPYRYSTVKLTQNQFLAKPADTFDGQCVTTAIGCQIIRNGNTIAWIHIPVHMLRNRFFNSAMNGWDGNSVDLGDNNGGTILAPQIGAGYKDADNTFTGIFMGTARDPKQEISDEINNTNNSSQGRFAPTGEDVGLFGYAKGQRSIFLDAKTGKAVFGVKNQSQIILDPSTKEAIIKSGDYKYDPNDNDHDGKKGSGMEINLTKPSITYGNGNFEVNNEGHLIARGGGQIAGWKIGNFRLYSNNGNTGMSSATGAGDKQTQSDVMKMSVPVTTLKNTENYTDEDGVQHLIWEAVTTNVSKSVAFWAQAAAGRKCFVTHDGYLRVTTAFIGNSNPIYIGETYQATDEQGGYRNLAAIFSNGKASINANRTGFYLGEDGLGIGPRAVIVTGQNDKNQDIETKISAFYVDAKTGHFYAKKGYIGTRAKGWTIEPGQMYNQKVSSVGWGLPGFYMSPQYGISIASLSSDGENEDSIDIIFSVNRFGVLTSKKAYIANWQMRENLLATSMVDKDGKTKYPNIGWAEYRQSEKNEKKYEIVINANTQNPPTNVAISNEGMRIGAGFLVMRNKKNNGASAYLKDAFLQGKVNAVGAKIGDWRVAGDSFVYAPNSVISQDVSSEQSTLTEQGEVGGNEVISNTKDFGEYIPIGFHGRPNYTNDVAIATIGKIRIGYSNLRGSNYSHPSGLMYAGFNRSRGKSTGNNLWWELSGDMNTRSYLKYGLQIQNLGILVHANGVSATNGDSYFKNLGISSKLAIGPNISNTTIQADRTEEINSYSFPQSNNVNALFFCQPSTASGGTVLKISNLPFLTGSEQRLDTYLNFLCTYGDETQIKKINITNVFNAIKDGLWNASGGYAEKVLEMIQRYGGGSNSGGDGSLDELGTGSSIGYMRVILSQQVYTYDGKSHKPTVTVTNDGIVAGSSQYTVRYQNDTTSVGRKAITVIGVANDMLQGWQQTVYYDIVAASGGSGSGSGSTTPETPKEYTVSISIKGSSTFIQTGNTIQPELTVLGYIKGQSTPQKTFSSGEYSRVYSPSYPTSAGTYTVKVKITASGNYKDKYSNQVSFIINKKTSTTKGTFGAENRVPGQCYQIGKMMINTNENFINYIRVYDKNHDEVKYAPNGNGYDIVSCWPSSKATSQGGQSGVTIKPTGSYTNEYKTTKIRYQVYEQNQIIDSSMSSWVSAGEY